MASRSIPVRFVILVTDTVVKESSGGRFGKLRGPGDELLPQVHTFGLGAAHDPMALLSIASKSQGTYSFVEDENTDDITGAIAVCLSGLKDVVAVGMRVRVKATVESGATIDKIDSEGYLTTRDDGRTSAEVSVGVLYAGEVKSFIVHLHVPARLSMTATDGDCCDKQQLLTASFIGDYTSSDEEAKLYVQRPPPEAPYGALQRVPVPLVMNHMARFGVLDIVTTFVEDIRERKFSSITAEVMAKKLRNKWEEFVQVRQFWSGLDLGVLDIEVSRMVSMLEEAAAAAGSTSGSSMMSATAYMMSWLSSYQMQRPTAMGSPGSVAAAFITVNMQLTLQQATIFTAVACDNVCGGGHNGCEACRDHCCMNPPPAPVLVLSEHGDDTYHVRHGAYPQGVLVNAINQAMEQMYMALVQASNLARCDDATSVKVLQA